LYGKLRHEGSAVLGFVSDAGNDASPWLGYVLNIDGKAPSVAHTRKDIKILQNRQGVNRNRKERSNCRYVAVGGLTVGVLHHTICLAHIYNLCLTPPLI
jgi:hypothetical protein